MQQRALGSQGLFVSPVGLGCMGMSDFYELASADEAESIATIHRALDLGVNFLDTSDNYGPFTNELLVGRALKGRRDGVILATKFGTVRRPDGTVVGIDGRPEYVSQACDASLQRLGVDHIDLYYQHRVDAQVPIEDTVGAMSDLVRQGKVGYLGLSEPAVATLRRAYAVHPISALQMEYSLWWRESGDEVLPAVRELGVGFVPYSPLGRGLLTGRYRAPADLPADDYRQTTPRFQGENLEMNVRLVDRLAELAQDKGLTPAQLALAWVLAQGNDVVPIPGTKRVRYLEQNVAAASVSLSPADLAAIEQAMPRGAGAGERYPRRCHATRQSIGTTSARKVVELGHQIGRRFVGP